MMIKASEIVLFKNIGCILILLFMIIFIYIYSPKTMEIIFYGSMRYFHRLILKFLAYQSSGDETEKVACGDGAN